MRCPVLAEVGGVSLSRRRFHDLAKVDSHRPAGIACLYRRPRANKRLTAQGLVTATGAS
jgi:hypothetical protein